MKATEFEALYLTKKEVQDILSVNDSRVSQLAKAGHIIRYKGGIYDRASVEAYRRKRGDKKGGRYPAK